MDRRCGHFSWEKTQFTFYLQAARDSDVLGSNGQSRVPLWTTECHKPLLGEVCRREAKKEHGTSSGSVSSYPSLSALAMTSGCCNLELTHSSTERFSADDWRKDESNWFFSQSNLTRQREEIMWKQSKVLSYCPLLTLWIWLSERITFTWQLCACCSGFKIINMPSRSLS